MKTATTTIMLAASAAAWAAISINAPTAAADDPATHTLGSQAQLVSGEITQGWTITDLKASSDEIPYAVKGALWEATATDEALQGSVTPLVFSLNARAASGQTYRALFHVATPQGVNPATLAQGQKTTGKVYFDIIGDSPTSVVYIAGGQDLLTWVQPPPSAPRTGTPSIPDPSRRQAMPAPVADPATPTPATTTAPTGSPATPAPSAMRVTPPLAGSQGTPLPVGNQGTPLPLGNQGTPLPLGNQGTPSATTVNVPPVLVTPEGTPHLATVGSVPSPGGSQDNPLSSDTEATLTPATTTAPAPAPPRA